MSRTLFQEALADAKQIRKFAEETAKKNIIEKITPRIKDMIEAQLMGVDSDMAAEYPEEEEVHDIDGNLPVDTAISHSVPVAAPMTPTEPDVSHAVSMPDENGMVTLDLNVFSGESAPGEETVELSLSPDGELSPVDDDEIELTSEALNALLTLVDRPAKPVSASSKVQKLTEQVKSLQKSNNIESGIYEVFSNLLNTYKYINETVVDETERELLEGKLDEQHKTLKGLKEFKKMAKKQLDEAMLTIKIDGFSDEQLNLDELNVTLESDEEDADAANGELPPPAEHPEASTDEDPSMDFGADMPSDDEHVKEEGYDLDENTILEIDEDMLKTEIERMRGDDSESDTVGDEPAHHDDMHMSDDDLHEVPSFEGDAAEVKSANPEAHTGEHLPSDYEPCGHCNFDHSYEPEEAYAWHMDARKAGKEDGHDEVIKAHAEAGLEECEMSGMEDKEVNEAEGDEEDDDAEMLTDKKDLTESKRVSSNKGSTQLADLKVAHEKLRAKLVEQNLFNAKLLYVNKLLQNAQLSSKQRTVAMERVDEAKSLREVKLVYESVVKTLAAKRNVNENRVLGSSSRVVGKGSSSELVTESTDGETARWAKLAGIK